MPACILLEQCAFFKEKMTDMPSTARIMKMKYCTDEGGSASCARYLIFEKLGQDKVPQDLLPSEIEKMEEILDI